MIKELIHNDEEFLAKPAEPATAEDAQVAQECGQVGPTHLPRQAQCLDDPVSHRVGKTVLEACEGDVEAPVRTVVHGEALELGAQRRGTGVREVDQQFGQPAPTADPRHQGVDDVGPRRTGGRNPALAMARSASRVWLTHNPRCR